MSLTLSTGPLSHEAVATVNYLIDGPNNKILFTPFPRRVRAVFAGENIVDTDNGMLLYESGIQPVLYVPVADVATDHLTKTGHSTHCPYKGDASYWTITVGDRSAENAVWGYEQPVDTAPWLDGYVAMYWGRLDQWFDEDVEVFGHLRDPYHRVDVRAASRPVRVTVAGEVVAESSKALVLSETGLPNRYYIPPSDVGADRFTTSDTSTHCPYKGDASYWSYTGGQEPQTDVVWSYASPFAEAEEVAGYWSFLGEDVTVEAVLES